MWCFKCDVTDQLESINLFEDCLESEMYFCLLGNRYPFIKLYIY